MIRKYKELLRILDNCLQRIFDDFGSRFLCFFKHRFVLFLGLINKPFELVIQLKDFNELFGNAVELSLKPVVFNAVE